MKTEMKERIIERAARHGVLLDEDDPALLFADIAMLVADDRAAEVAEKFKDDVKPARDILDKFENLETVIGSENSGLVKEIKLSIKLMEEAISDMGGAYDVERDAAKQLAETLEEVRGISKSMIGDLRENAGDLRALVQSIFKDAIRDESQTIVKELAETLRGDLLNDVREESVKHVLGRNTEDATKADLAARVKTLEAREDAYKEHYKEAQFWRGASPWLTAASIVGGAGIAAVSIAMYLMKSGVITIVY